jgi:hypothetical protein
MLSEQEIKQALRASRVMPMPVPALHGPFGWEQLAQTIAHHLSSGSGGRKVVQSLEIPAETWEKLEQLADQAARSAARPVSVAEVAAAILQEYFHDTR